MFRYIIKNLRELLTREQPNILAASAGMMVLVFGTKVIGLFTKTAAVSQLGAENYGIFIAANTLPEILSTLFIFGTITSVIIPILVDELSTKGKGSFDRLFSSIVNTGLLLFIGMSILIALLAGKIMPFVIERVAQPVEPFSQEQISQITLMLRLLLIPQVILGVSSLISSALNTFKRFIIPQLAPLFYNIGILFGALVLIPASNGTSWGLAWGSLIGAILHLAIQIPLSSHLNINYRLTIGIASDKMKDIFVRALPRIIALAADQIALGIDRIIAIGLGASALGAYHLAVSLVSIPFSLFSNTFSVAALPHLSIKYAEKNMTDFKRIFSKVFNQILFLTVPVGMVLLVLRLPIVRLLYGIIGNEFTWENTLMVAWVVFFFSLGLIPEVLGVFLSRAFYSIQDTVRPLFVGLYVVVGGITTGILFSNYFSHFHTFSLKALVWNPEFFLSKGDGVAAVGGLALSSSLIYSSSFLLLLLLFIKKIGSLNRRDFWISALRKIVFGLIMAFIMYFLLKLWDEVLDTARTVNVFILTISTIVPGLCIYFWLVYIFKDPEIAVLSKLIGIIRKVFTI